MPEKVHLSILQTRKMSSILDFLCICARQGEGYERGQKVEITGILREKRAFFKTNAVILKAKETHVRTFTAAQIGGVYHRCVKDHAHMESP